MDPPNERVSVVGDFTQQQTLGEQLEAKRLSLQATAPPSEVPGYKLEKFLGAGAFGQAWLGRDLNTGRRVAVKFYLHRSGVNWSLLSREVKNLVQLSAHRHIVQVLEVGWDADPPYYVMEYLPSGSLEDLLRARQRMPVSQAVEMFREICIGLNHSHGKGVLHCDLKPANILLDEDYRPRLADFGQSRMSHDQTPALGTLFYMAPEQADLEAAPDARWDVYGLGAILYRMLTGRAPHRSEGLVERIDTAGSLPKRLERYRQAILRDGPPRDHHKVRGVDRALAAIVDRCLAVNPNERFANAQQVIVALDRRAAVVARRPLMWLGIVAPLLLLLATCIYAGRSIIQARDRTTVALRQEAFSSNQFAAKFAARTLESELRSYFDAAQREADQAALRELLSELLADPTFADQRKEIAERQDAEAVREQMLEHPQRLELERYLNTTLARYLDRPESDPRRPRLATLFVTDHQGTFLGIAYDEPVPSEQDSAGRNYAFRTYFHGGREDLPPDTDPAEIAPLRRPHLSAAFQSTATGLWKVAFSTPIYLDPDDAAAAADDSVPDPVPDAILVATTNLGDFELLRAAADAGATGNQIAALVDARPGEQRGTILQHPLMDLRRERGEELAAERFQVPPNQLELLLRGRNVDYQDPTATAPDGEPYGGTWIAAVEPVTLPLQAAGTVDETTDLLVLVQYRLSKVVQPVGTLVHRLMFEGLLTASAVLVMLVVLWYLVMRVGDEPTEWTEPPSDPAGGTPEPPPETVPNR